jgi:hypothetical protein
LDGAANVQQSDWWHAGTVLLFDLQAGIDPFEPENTRTELKGAGPAKCLSC